MPEIEPQIMKGYGIKQMPGYKCDLKIDQLNKKRDEFWASKNKLNITKWKIIHQACIYDHINAEEFLFKNNIRTLNGCINMCLDEGGKLYRVPNFCINDPTFQLELLNNENSKKEKINIILNDVAAQKKKNYNIYDTTTGKELLCSMKDNSAKLLGLEDVIVKKVWENDGEQHIDVELPRRTKHPRLVYPIRAGILLEK